MSKSNTPDSMMINEQRVSFVIGTECEAHSCLYRHTFSWIGSFFLCVCGNHTPIIHVPGQCAWYFFLCLQTPSTHTKQIYHYLISWDSWATTCYGKNRNTKNCVHCGNLLICLSHLFICVHDGIRIRTISICNGIRGRTKKQRHRTCHVHATTLGVRQKRRAFRSFWPRSKVRSSYDAHTEKIKPAMCRGYLWWDDMPCGFYTLSLR